MVFDDINDIPKHYPDVDVALFHLGGTTVLGTVVTMDAKEGLEMFRIINPKKVIPIHYNDYDVFKSSLEEFQQKLETQLSKIKCITCTMEKHTTSS
jgi:L-ascorbate metabolism protein UlaG (beta-lactamase superfamily)